MKFWLMSKSFFCIAFFSIFSVFSATHAYANCERAISHFAINSVHREVLRAIALTESGLSKNNTLEAVPYAINHKGRALYYSKYSDALRFIRGRVKAGDTAFDVGCMQLNYRLWRPYFTSDAAMLSPVNNVKFAYALLRVHINNTGRLSDAIARYHSRTPSRGQDYLCRVLRYAPQLRKKETPPC